MNQISPALLELKNSINKMKNALESIRNRSDDMEDRICELKDKHLEVIQVEENREIRSKKMEEILLYRRQGNIKIMVIPEEKKRRKQSLFKEIIADNFPYMGKKLDIQVHEGKRTPNYLNAKRPSARHIILKLSKNQ